MIWVRLNTYLVVESLMRATNPLLLLQGRLGTALATRLLLLQIRSLEEDPGAVVLPKACQKAGTEVRPVVLHVRYKASGKLARSEWKELHRKEEERAARRTVRRQRHGDSDKAPPKGHSGDHSSAPISVTSDRTPWSSLDSGPRISSPSIYALFLRR